MNPKEAERIANEIMDIYSIYGGDEYAGEKVTQLEHMVQTAYNTKPITNLLLIPLKPTGIAGWYILYWKVTGQF